METKVPLTKLLSKKSWTFISQLSIFAAALKESNRGARFLGLNGIFFGFWPLIYPRV